LERYLRFALRRYDMAAVSTSTHRISHVTNMAAAVPVRAITASITLTPEESGTVVMSGTDAVVVTLPPAVSAPGMVFTLINTATGGNTSDVSFGVAAADSIYGTCPGMADTTYASPVVLATSAGKGAINTQATHRKGDMLKVISDGTDSWYVIESRGIWAALT
jgi:hypothetical protein